MAAKSFSRVILFMMILAVIFVKVNTNTIPLEVFNEDQWVVDAQNSIKDSLAKAESHGVENEKIQMTANHAFDTFTKFVEMRLIEVTDKMKIITSDEDIPVLQTQLIEWVEGLEQLNNESDINDKTPSKALGKFLIAIDFVAKEVVGFNKNYEFKSLESKQVVEDINFVIKEAVIKLEEYAKSVEDQIAGMSKMY